MTGSTVGLLLVVAAGAQPYVEAYREMKSDGRPLLVLVGADWCPACRTMKSATLLRMQLRGRLEGVAFTVVDLDREPQLAHQIMRGSSIPQLVMYRNTRQGWKRTQLTGGQSEDRIRGFLTSEPPSTNFASSSTSGDQ